MNDPSEIFIIANSLAENLAEAELADNMGEMFVENPSEKAHKVRLMSEENMNWTNPAVQEYRRARRSIYGALYQCLEGYKGWKLTKQ